MPCRGYGAFAIHDKEISVRSMFAACSLERKERDMQYIVTAQEMKKYESFAMERIGIPPLLLMERAAMEMRDVLMRYVREKSRILVFAGTGNNGGDALAVGRLLAEKGAEVSFYMPGNRRRVSAETRKQLSILRNLGFAVFSKLPEAEYDIVIDGLFGIGLSRDIEGVYESAVEEIARFRAKGALVASVDIPWLVQRKTDHKVRFKAVSVQEAQRLYLEELEELNQMRKRIHRPCKEVLECRQTSRRIRRLFL